MKSRFAAMSALLVPLVVPVAAQADGGDCHDSAGVYLGARPYIVNPSVRERAATTVVAIVHDPSLIGGAMVAYRLEVRPATGGGLVYSQRGIASISAREPLELKFDWDGRRIDGRSVADGEYEVSVVARVHPPREPHEPAPDDAAIERMLRTGVEAQGSSINVVVDRKGVYDSLFEGVRAQEDVSATVASLDPDFAYQFFFGTTHGHTNWSDGGMPVTDCTSGRYGYPGGARPVDAWSYARNTAKLHFLAVVEHNHLMQEGCSGCTEQGVRDRYAAGFTNAMNATVDGSFVALFGMEWGVISGAGHINIYNQNRLMAWDGEPYHVLTPKSDYPRLYTAIRNNQPTGGSYGTFNHPESTDFGSFTRTADGDAVMRGLSVVSGPAFSTSTSFTPGGTRYETRYRQALSYGWRVGPEAHQDNHCWNWGTSTPNRTVALVPNGTTFSQQSLLAAINARRFYASEDRDAQLIFRTTNGTSVMGTMFTTTNPSINVTAKLLDPSGEGVQKIEIWGGQAGTSTSPGALPTVHFSNTGSTTLSVSLPRRTAGQRWYYYVRAVQADGDILWSSPIWINW
jgi:hypothetical protein